MAKGSRLPCKEGVRVGVIPRAFTFLSMGTGEPDTSKVVCPVRRGTGRKGSNDLARGLPYVRHSSSCSIPIVDGKDSEEILGSAAYLHSKERGDKSMPIKPGTTEDAYIVARQDPRDMAKARLPEVQCQSVDGGPLATASDSEVDLSPR